MKYAFAAAVATLALVGAAVAQPTPAVTPPAAPAAPVAASACPHYPAPPTTPTADAIRNPRELNAGTEAVNGYLNQYNTVHQCHVDEIKGLQAQLDARVAEARAGQDGAVVFRTNWQTTVDAVTARAAQKQKLSRH